MANVRSIAALLVPACGAPTSDGPAAMPVPAGRTAVSTQRTDPTVTPSVDSWADARQGMVREQIETRGIHDPRVVAAMRQVPRHAFVPPPVRSQAYADHPLPIGHEVTISQPYIVALMTQLAEVDERSRVLEVGTGSGYQSAVLAQMGAKVFSIEIIGPLVAPARARLKRLGYEVEVREGDGYEGWREHAPFDAIIVTAAPPRVPEPLKQQLAEGGKLVIPVGEAYQELRVITRRGQDFVERVETPVRFVPMTGKAQGG